MAENLRWGVKIAGDTAGGKVSDGYLLDRGHLLGFLIRAKSWKGIRGVRSGP